jgi:hypothetical protein
MAACSAQPAIIKPEEGFLAMAVSTCGNGRGLRRWNASASTVGSQSAAMFNLWGVDGMPIYACGQPTLDGAMAVVHKVRHALPELDCAATRLFEFRTRACAVWTVGVGTDQHCAVPAAGDVGLGQEWA